MYSECIYLLRSYWVPAMVLGDWISRDDLSISLSWLSSHPAPPESGPELGRGNTERSHTESKFTVQWRRQKKKMWRKLWLSYMLSTGGYVEGEGSSFGVPSTSRLGLTWEVIEKWITHGFKELVRLEQMDKDEKKLQRQGTLWANCNPESVSSSVWLNSYENSERWRDQGRWQRVMPFSFL